MKHRHAAAPVISLNRRQRRVAGTDLFEAALACHQAGRLAQAERIYRRILANQPNHVAALANLGLAALTQGRAEEAVVTLRRAVSLRPDNTQAALNLAEALRATGALEQALAAYRRAAALVPPSAVLQNNIGVVQAALGQPRQAIETFRQAIRLDPNYADAHANAGRLLLRLGEVAEAVGALQCAVSLAPASAVYLADLGLALTRQGAFDAGEAACRAAVAHAPDYVTGHVNLAHALVQQRKYVETIAVCDAGLSVAPHTADLHCSRAAAALMTGALEAAEAAPRTAIGLQPSHAAAWFNLGMIHERKGDLAAALTAQRAALAIDPGFAGAELKMAHALLGLGDFANGWRHFEARWRTAEHVSNFQHVIGQPGWRGESLDGRTILLHWEQGLGDTLQLLRYVPMVAARGGRVLLMVQAPLRGLVPAWPGVTLVTDPANIPDFDLHCSFFSLPAACGTTPDTVPAPIPYLHADSGLITQWRGKLPDRSTDGAARKIRVGLVWAGSAEHKGDSARSVPLACLQPLLAVPGLRFFSLQRDMRAGDAAWLAGPGRHITPLGPELGDFADTAAALAAMDLLVTVDTSVCHLAGALGYPTWLLLPFSPEWRWAIDETHSRWYPTVRLWRQSEAGNWPALLARVAAELATLKPEPN